MTLAVALQSDLQASTSALRRKLAALGISRWIYVGDDAAWLVRAKRSGFLDFAHLQTGELFERFAWELRQPYIEWIGELSRLNASPEWWASELAAKSPYTGLYSRICSLAAARELIVDGMPMTLAVCSTEALAQEVRLLGLERGLDVRRIGSSVKPRVREVAFAGAKRLLRGWGRVTSAPLLGLPGRVAPVAERYLPNSAAAYRRRVLARLGAERVEEFSGEDTVLLFTWVDERSFDERGGYRDPHFGDLPGLLAKRGLRVAYVPRVISGTPFEPTVGRLLTTGETFVFPDLYLNSGDWRACERRARTFRPAVPADATVGDISVARLAREQVDRYRHALPGTLSYEPLVKGLAATGVRPARTVILYEGHAWEQSLTAAMHRQMSETALIGYENVNFSRMALSMYPARSEIGIRPLPDRVVTNGETFRRVLIGEGFPEERVKVGCGLRHGYLHDNLIDGAAADGDTRAGPARVLLATSSYFGHSVELLDKVLTAFGGDSGYELIVKCHPLVDEAELRPWVPALSSSPNVRFSDRPIAELLPEADMMLYSYSMVCYEALAHGVPPVFVKSDVGLNLDQLEPFLDLGRQARTPEELRRTADEIAVLDEDARRQWEEHARIAVREALAPVTPACTDAFLA